MDMNTVGKLFLSVIRDGYRNWNIYSARSTRIEFWLWALHAYPFVLVISTTGDNGAVLILIPTVPSIAMWVRRIHDTGHRIWWCIIPGVGGIINIVLLLSRTNTEETRWARPGELRPTQE